MCDLRDTCSLYGRDQYLTGLGVTCFCHSLPPLAADYVMTWETEAIPSSRQQYYLIMRFKQGGLKHVALLLSGLMMQRSLCHINYFPTVPHAYVRVTRT